jgi:hypothetical protein
LDTIMNPEESGVSKVVNETPFIARNFSVSEKYRLAALSLAFFAARPSAMVDRLVS